MMGLTSGPLIRALFLFALKIPLIVLTTVGRVEDYFGRVYGMGSGIFVPILINSIGDDVPLFVFVTIVFESKVGQLIEIFWRPKSLFSLQISKPVL